MASGQNANYADGLPHQPQLQQTQFQPPQPQDHPSPMKKIPITTEEEKRVLKECESESFFKRALPLSFGAMLGVQTLVKTGKMAGHPKYGAIPKTIIACGFAYIVGKISYMPVCRRKILEQIPDSNLAILIKQKESGTLPDMNDQGTFGEKQAPADKDSGDFNKKSKFPTDSSPSFEGLSDSQRPSMDNEVKVKDPAEEDYSHIKLNYGDLRHKNRRDNSQSKPTPPADPGAPSYKDSPYMPQKTWPDKKSPPPNQGPPGASDDPSAQAPKKKRTNMWGDVIED